jgi:ABC-type multidrug transport system permease subunit
MCLVPRFVRAFYIVTSVGGSVPYPGVHHVLMFSVLVDQITQAAGALPIISFLTSSLLCANFELMGIVFSCRVFRSVMPHNLVTGYQHF